MYIHLYNNGDCSSTQIYNSLGITVIYVAITKSKDLCLYLRVKTTKTEVQ